MESPREAEGFPTVLFQLSIINSDPIKEDDQRRNRRRGQKVPFGTFITVIKLSKLLTQNRINIDLLGLDFTFTVDSQRENG